MNQSRANWKKRNETTPSAIPSEPQKRVSRPIRIAHRRCRRSRRRGRSGRRSRSRPRAPCSEDPVIVSVAFSLACRLPSSLPSLTSSGTTLVTKSPAASTVVTAIRTAATARNSGPATTTPTSWPRTLSLRARAAREEEVEGQREEGRRRSPAGCRRAICEPEWASTLRSSSESPPPPPTLRGDDDRGDHEDDRGQGSDPGRVATSAPPRRGPRPWIAS